MIIGMLRKRCSAKVPACESFFLEILLDIPLSGRLRVACVAAVPTPPAGGNGPSGDRPPHRTQRTTPVGFG
jgi:hypothetical protein